MKRKIISILIFMLQIATTASASVMSNEKQEKVNIGINEIEDFEENIKTIGGWEECMETCTGITGLAGNC